MIVSAVSLTIIGGGCSDQKSAVSQKPTPPPPKIELGKIVFLTTQWYPQPGQPESVQENRLARELARQSVLMSLREDFGIVTRDETLGELNPNLEVSAPAVDAAKGNAKKPAEPLSLSFSMGYDGSWDAQLFGAGSVPENPVWQHRGSIKHSQRTMYGELAAQLAEAGSEIEKRLRAAGASGEARPVNPENTPPAEVEKSLAEMNFVSQYAAIRAAHRAIAEKGPSLEWLSVLVRGYAHLAILVEHTWASHTEAFAARSLLYAERMTRLDGGAHEAPWHRAYARAVIGAHGAALDQLEAIEQSVPAAKQASGEANSGQQHAWTEVIAPYATFDHAALQKVATDHPELSELVALLQWNLYRSYMHGRWIYEHGQDAMRTCPEAYGVYAIMGGWPALKVQRFGIHSGTRTFAARLPARAEELADLPASVRTVVQEGDQPQRSFGAEQISARPMNVSRALREAAGANEDSGECSWAILASLIAEEQFVEAATLLKVSRNAVEHSHAPLVEVLLPLVEDHRLAPYIRAWATSRTEVLQAEEIVRTLSIPDPRARMRDMFVQMWGAPSASGEDGGRLAWRSLFSRNYTLPSLIDSWLVVGQVLPTAMANEANDRCPADFAQVSPLSPNALRLQWEMPKGTIEPDQLKKWEGELREDPVGWMSLGNVYYKRGDLEGAMRCYRRSLDISPSKSATEGLANCYYHSGKKDLWQSTLESYLKIDDLGLAHANIHESIAHEQISNRKWREALPHAISAAGTYSADGLMLASTVYEGLHDWKKAEHFAAEASRNYRSSMTGANWYHFCRRTGHGDESAAEEIAKQNVEAAAQQHHVDCSSRIFLYEFFQGNNEAALAALEQGRPRAKDSWDQVWLLLHAIALAGEMKDAPRKQQAIEETRALVEQEIKPNDPAWSAVVEGLCRAHEGQKLDEAFLKQYDATVGASTSPDARCNYWYYMGAALSQQGLLDEADVYLKRAAFGGPFRCYNATLAGNLLVKRHGPGRGGVPAEFAPEDAGSENADGENVAGENAAEDQSEAADPDAAEERESATDQSDAKDAPPRDSEVGESDPSI